MSSQAADKQHGDVDEVVALWPGDDRCEDIHKRQQNDKEHPLEAAQECDDDTQQAGHALDVARSFFEPRFDASRHQQGGQVQHHDQAELDQDHRAAYVVNDELAVFLAKGEKSVEHRSPLVGFGQ